MADRFDENYQRVRWVLGKRIVQIAFRTLGLILRAAVERPAAKDSSAVLASRAELLQQRMRIVPGSDHNGRT
jgi:hypothetical protein